jgi:hypothetical protein
MEIYNKVKTPPKEALKVIGAGRLKGKFDISPQWRIEILTETFGACGFGWYYDVSKLERVEASNGEVAVLANIDLYVKWNNEWSKPIPGQGGSMFVSNESRGAYVSDEAEKMAITDAISVAAKQLGIAADVYRGMFDTKYIAEKAAEVVVKPELVPSMKKVWDKAAKHLSGGGELKTITDVYSISEENLKLLKDAASEIQVQ